MFGTGQQDKLAEQPPLNQALLVRDEVGLRGFRRGGAWGIGAGAGVLYLALSNGPGNTNGNVGFRVSR